MRIPAAGFDLVGLVLVAAAIGLLGLAFWLTDKAYIRLLVGYFDLFALAAYVFLRDGLFSYL